MGAGQKQYAGCTTKASIPNDPYFCPQACTVWHLGIYTKHWAAETVIERIHQTRWTWVAAVFMLKSSAHLQALVEVAGLPLELVLLL